jgi:glycosyltransferase involved in cell wall biosynthesis
MFSLCIPTLDRFDNFLSRYLVQYLENEYINEIIITDENGNDIEKINNAFPNNSKLILIKNESRLGPFLNKMKACSFAKNEWIVLMDSDNFAHKDYFVLAKKYIENLMVNADVNLQNIILAPSKARPNFDFSHLSGFVYKKGDFVKNIHLDNETLQQHNSPTSTLMNTGNYVINKFLIDNLNLTTEMDNIQYSSACDVIYFNTLLFEQFDVNMHVVANMEYDHVVHDGSIYIQTNHLYRVFNRSVHTRFYNLV